MMKLAHFTLLMAAGFLSAEAGSFRAILAICGAKRKYIAPELTLF